MSQITKNQRRLLDEYAKSNGVFGMIIVSDANAVQNDNYFGFLAITDTIISSITYKSPSLVSGTLTGITIPSGLFVPISGGIATLTLTSGSIILYK